MLKPRLPETLSERLRLNRRGQGLIQSIFAAGIIMLILSAAAPLGQNSAKLLAKMRFNAAVNELRDTLIAVATNTALCDPAIGTDSWLLPIGRNVPVWPASILNSQTPIGVMVVLPFYDSNHRNIELVPYGTPANQIPNSPLNPPGVATSSWMELTGQTAADALQINGLEFVPNAPAPGYNPVQGDPVNGYTVSGTLQFAASLAGSDGSIATTMQTVINMQVLMDGGRNPKGIQVMNSKQQTCEQYGGVYDGNSGQCRFGFVSTQCNPGQYISQFNSLGQATCQPLHLVCPNYPNAAMPAKLYQAPLNLPEALSAIVNGQPYCTPVVSPQGVYFAQNSELTAQGSGALTAVQIDLSQAQSTPMTIQVSYTGGQNGYNYTAPPSPITVTIPAGASSAPIANFIISNSGDANIVIVTFTLVSNPPTSPSLPNFTVTSPNTTYLTIGASLTPDCPAQAVSWVDQTTNLTCNGNLTPWPNGQSETIAGSNTTSGSGTAIYSCSGSAWTEVSGTCTNQCPYGYAWDYVGTTNSGTPLPTTQCTSTNYGTNSSNNNNWYCGCTRTCNNNGTIPCSGGSVASGHLCLDLYGVNSGFPWMYTPSNNKECVCVPNAIPCS